MDVHSKEVRSFNMSRIRSKGTKPEVVVRKFLFSMGYRYKIHDTKLPGKPDIVLPKYKTVIFVQGCFWHGHENCKDFVIPKTRTKWWLEKININKQNDYRNEITLKNVGWKVLHIWECELKSSVVENTFKLLINELQN